MIWTQWLVPVEARFEYTKFSHFEYEERSIEREHIETSLARLIHSYHTYSRTDNNLLATLGYPVTAQVLTGDQRPTNADSRRGHLAEILACEFTRNQFGYDLPVHRLRYNPNPDQSMKGDDILGFRFATNHQDIHNVLVGEAKYRSQYSSTAVVEAHNALYQGFRPYPVSLEFVSTILFLEGNREKSDQIRQIKNLLASMSKQVIRFNLIFLATEGKPRDPFACLEEKDDVISNLIVVNVSFQEGITDWLDRIYEQNMNYD